MRRTRISIIFGVIAAVAILAATVLQSIAMLTVFEPKSHFFKIGAVLPTAALIAALLGSICGLVAALTKREPTPTAFSPRLYTAIPTALITLAAAILLPIFASGTESSLALVLPTSAALVLMALYTLLSACTSVREGHAGILAFLGFSAPLACALFNAYYYFDLSIEMNSPFKYCPQLALLFSMLYFLGEIRYLIGEPKPRLFSSLSACALAACGLCAIAFPVALFAGRIERFDYVTGAVLALGICVRIVSCMIPQPTTPAPTEEESPTPSELPKEDDPAV